MEREKRFWKLAMAIGIFVLFISLNASAGQFCDKISERLNNTYDTGKITALRFDNYPAWAMQQGGTSVVSDSITCPTEPGLDLRQRKDICKLNEELNNLKYLASEIERQKGEISKLCAIAEGMQKATDDALALSAQWAKERKTHDYKDIATRTGTSMICLIPGVSSVRRGAKIPNQCLAANVAIGDARGDLQKVYLMCKKNNLGEETLKKILKIDDELSKGIDIVQDMGKCGLWNNWLVGGINYLEWAPGVGGVVVAINQMAGITITPPEENPYDWMAKSTMNTIKNIFAEIKIIESDIAITYNAAQELSSKLEYDNMNLPPFQ